MLIENAMEIYHRIVQKTLPVLKKQPVSSYITAAIILFLSSEIYSQVTVPKHLRPFARVSFLSLVRSFMRKDSVVERNKRLIAPIVNQGHKVYVAKLPFEWSLSIADPELAKMMLLKSDMFPKSQEFRNKLGEGNIVVRFMGSENVALANGHKWKRQRKFMNPAFHRSMPINTFGNLMFRLFDRIDEQPHDFPVSIRLKNFTLDALGLAAFDFDFKALLGDPDGWTKTYDTIMKSLFNPWVFLFSNIDFILQAIIPSRRQSTAAVIKFNKMLIGMAERRRQEIQRGEKKSVPDSEKDLLTLLIEADLEEGNTATNDELRENIALFFLAGHDTTGNALSFCLYNLAKNKHVQDKLREEILSVMDDRDPDAIPTAEDFKKMPYLNMVIKENLRLSGPVDRLISRVTTEDIMMEGHVVPKGTYINVDIASLHFNPNYWHDPQSFIPERFEDDGEHSHHAGMTWLPFSNGSRQCLGMNFSLTEQRVFLAMLLRRYVVDISKDSIHYEKIVYDKLFNFAPASLTLNFSKRQ
ncbi:cytochrome P450 [Choanephora cucurbitarum]|nr:cytochrome P450 [Choanephora cucurbitarum]